MASLGLLRWHRPTNLPAPSLTRLIIARAQVAFLLAICTTLGLAALRGASELSNLSRTALLERLQQQAADGSHAQFSLAGVPDGVPANHDNQVQLRRSAKVPVVALAVKSSGAAVHHLASRSGHFRPSSLIVMPVRFALRSGTPPPDLVG